MVDAMWSYVYRRHDLLHGILPVQWLGWTGPWMRVRARADINTTITVSARACINMALLRLSDVDARRRQATGGTRRDLIIGCAVLAA